MSQCRAIWMSPTAKSTAKVVEVKVINRLWKQIRRWFRSDIDDDDDLDALINSPEFGEFMDMMEAETEQQLTSLSLSQYVDLAAEVPMPTPEQRENFVSF